jgi:bleomycin hydrolase
MPDASSSQISLNQIGEFRQRFEADSHSRLAMNAVTKTSAKTVATNRRAVTRLNHTFSHAIKTGAATSQNSSGRCWMFAGLNLFRMKAAEALNLEDFELSQTYTMFWDKLEKSNYFLETILNTLDEPTDGRLISWLVIDPVQDGGQWDMFVNLVEKYGVVPKSVMPETESSSASRVMNERITLKLREYASQLRSEHQNGKSLKSLRAMKPAMLEEIFRILSIHLGEPPTEFNWQWRDKDKEFHRDGIITPHDFYQKYIKHDLDPMVCLIHCPQASKQFNEVYTIELLGNVVGGRKIRYLNVELPVMKAAAVATIKDQVPVWFGCDVGKMLDRELGLMDLDIFDYEGLYNVPFGMTKAERLDYGSSQMTHAMVFTGVDLDDDGKPIKWRVENSWGDKDGDKGHFVMTDPWFDEYNYEVVVEKRYLSPELQAILAKEPVPLPPWDPMGALAT